MKLSSTVTNCTGSRGFVPKQACSVWVCTLFLRGWVSLPPGSTQFAAFPILVYWDVRSSLYINCNRWWWSLHVSNLGYYLRVKTLTINYYSLILQVWVQEWMLGANSVDVLVQTQKAGCEPGWCELDWVQNFTN